TDEREEFLRGLDGVERVVAGFYRLLLGAIVAAVVAVVVFVTIRRPWGNGNQGEWFYFSIAVLLVLGWAVGQFVMLGRRQRRERPLASLHSSTEDGVRRWEFRFGRAAGESHENAGGADGEFRFGFSKSFEVPLASLPAGMLPDEESLACLERELQRGIEIEEACTLVQPAFADWNEREREAYRLYVTKLLDERRLSGSAAGQIGRA
ncbi:MAG: hypothetical protein WD403_10025, partial [Pirellulales bacterium]